MPHIIVEYSKNIENKVEIAPLLKSMHDALAKEDGNLARIKTRSIGIENSVVGESHPNEGQMVHITLLLLEGRDEKTKLAYATPIHDIAKDVVRKEYPDCAVTLEVRDMDKGTYLL